MATPNLLGTPQDFNRLGAVKTAMETGWARIPTYYYDVTQHQFPLSDTEFTSAFGGTIKVFNLDQSDATAGRQTNAATGSGINEPFLALGCGIVAVGEGEAFTVPGAVTTLTSGNTPAFNGAVPLAGLVGSAGKDSDARNAALWWGGATWDFIEKFFSAYRLQVKAARRWLLVDEALFDVGMVPTPPEFVGASNSNAPVMPFVKDVNRVLAAKADAIGGNYQFLPQNTAGTSAVGAPTAGVTWGAPKIVGLANRLYCFGQPILMLPGMTFDTSFVRVENDAVYYNAMQRDAVFAGQKPSTEFNEGIEGVDGYSTVFHVPGGTLSLGLVFKGYALHPQAVVDYVQNYLSPDSMALKMLAGNAMLQNLAVRNSALAGTLAGITSSEK